MSHQDHPGREPFDAHARTLLGKDPGFAHFYAHTLAATDDEDLAQIDPARFEAVLRHSYAGLGQREADGHLINIWSPDTETPPKLQVVDVFVENMPFLVDSVLGALRAEGATISLITHPILPVDPKGARWQVLENREDAPHFESFLHIHIDPITDEVVLARLFSELDAVLKDVRRAVEGWRPMLERLRALVHEYRGNTMHKSQAALAEALHFLAWLADHNFTFMGMREYRLEGEGAKASLVPVGESGLGILQDPSVMFLRSGADYVEMTPQHVAFLNHAEPLMVTKTNVRSRVHRRGHMDYVGAKLYDKDGQLSGELRIIGLFTSQSLHVPHTEVPLIRRKLAAVMKKSGFDPKSHAGKALMAALDNYPREELFQISNDDLYEFASVIAGLPDRPRVRVLPRIDPFDNFVSIQVFVARDRYSSGSRARIGEYLAQRYDGRVSAYYPHFPEGDLVRVHFIIGRNGGKTPCPDRAELEAEVEALTRGFGDLIAEAAEDPGSIAAYRDAFPAGYQTSNNHLDALADIAVLRTLENETDLAVRLADSEERRGDLAMKIYHCGRPIALTDRVPMLENFGFRVIDESTHRIHPRGQEPVYLHDMVLQIPDEIAFNAADDAARVDAAVLAVWRAESDSDPYNQLVLRAGLSAQETSVLRAYGRYMRQIGLTFSQRYLATTLGVHPQAAQALFKLFSVRLDPAFTGDREAESARLSSALDDLLTGVSSLDEDRIIRHFRNLIMETLRTNYFQRGEDGGVRPALALKLNSHGVEGMPAPRPMVEIFVFSPRVEGVHLRFGAIARGGIRWSDRPEDFRTEILGLVKAQQVKNAIIVPVGAKGGFVPKQMPVHPDRDTMMAEGTACYKIFIGTLLDVTDNLDGDVLVPPSRVLRRDGDDPYLVVAADKGTASFSDIANGIARERRFWLDDAFASGGSAGYDHKKMGITARGGWEAVKRHFREMNRDIQAEPFTVVGVGDMSGDVFGNGMLLSRQTRLVAAFDHRDIFIDPDPDPEASYDERRRLFEMGRSSWQDYDEGLLSQGGGIYSRQLKSIALSPESQRALGLETDAISPQDLMRAILMAEADLLWFGGIGTYVRAAGESDAEVGDRANDGLRITGTDVKVKVIGEGANLGMTQRGRIEYALKGGRINTDAIDNSAGVNSSDLEVNIKIALGSMVRTGEMPLETRNAFLVEMTGEVAELCLKNNYLQSLALSLAERRALADMPDHISLIQAFEQAKHLDRAVEFLPDNATLYERQSSGKPLARPELAVLLAYAKNTLYADLLESNVPDDPYLATELYRYFPDRLKADFPQSIEGHRLRRQVIATVLSNAMINRGGPSYVNSLTAATSARPADIAHAYAAARDAFSTTELNAAIDELDNQVDGAVQLALYAEVQALLVNQTLWFLRNVSFINGLSGVVERYRKGVDAIRELLGRAVPQVIAQSIADQAVGFIEGGAPRDLARRIAELSALTLASDIVLVAERRGASISDATAAYFQVLSLFRLGRITEQGGRIALSDRYERMALDRALANLMRAQCDLTSDVLASGDGSVATRFAAWHDPRAGEIDRIVAMVTDLIEGDLTVSRLSVAAGLLSDLVRV